MDDTKCHHKCPYKREAEGDPTHADRKGEVNVKMEVEMGVMGTSNVEPPEVRRGQEQILP